jgi:hypothetical protein
MASALKRRAGVGDGFDGGEPRIETRLDDFRVAVWLSSPLAQISNENNGLGGALGTD